MPFVFWKGARQEDIKSPLLSDDATRVESELDLDPRNQDSGTFTFEDMERLPELPTVVSQHQPDVSTTPFSSGSVDEDAPLLYDEEIQSQCQIPVSKADGNAPSCNPLESFRKQDATMPSKAQVLSKISAKSAVAILEKIELPRHDQNIGVHLQNGSDASTPALLAHNTPSTQAMLFSVRQTSVAKQRADSAPRRLHRPTELNLSSNAEDDSKPQTELEKRFDLMRNSKSQTKATLRSPTSLLKERLNMSPKKSRHDKVRVFVPPQPSRNGCLLPGPAGQVEAFASASVRARTGSNGRPAWWCKTDKLVVFDGINLRVDGQVTVHTRTSKGLSIARRRGDTETIIIPMDCAHCQEMLNRHEWKYDIQVCKRSVCWDCKERCKWEHEQTNKEHAASVTATTERNRDRADSVLQDNEVSEEDLMQKMGIEQGRPKSPIEAVGGIAERLENTNIWS